MTLSYQDALDLKEHGFPQDVHDFKLSTLAYCVKEECCGNELHLLHEDNDEGGITGNDYAHRIKAIWSLDTEEEKSAVKEKEKTNWVVVPSLEELIEACGEEFYSLSKSFDRWVAVYGTPGVATGLTEGSSPIQAVASLYCALHPKLEEKYEKVFMDEQFKNDYPPLNIKS